MNSFLAMSSDQAAVSNDDEASPVSGPLVFSCGKCRTIVGDSFSFLCSNEEEKTITLAAASNVKRGAHIFTSYNTLDEGNSYFDVNCLDAGCKEKLGRYYVTTSKELDHVREKFTFSVDAITSYELGKAQFGHTPDAEVIELPAAEEEEPEVAVASVETVQEDVSKVPNPLHASLCIQPIFLKLHSCKIICHHRFTTCLWI